MKNVHLFIPLFVVICSLSSCASDSFITNAVSLEESYTVTLAEGTTSESSIVLANLEVPTKLKAQVQEVIDENGFFKYELEYTEATATSIRLKMEDEWPYFTYLESGELRLRTEEGGEEVKLGTLNHDPNSPHVFDLVSLEITQADLVSFIDRHSTFDLVFIPRFAQAAPALQSEKEFELEVNFNLGYSVQGKSKRR